MTTPATAVFASRRAAFSAWLLSAAIVLAPATSLRLSAQTAGAGGAITGSVIDATTGKFLEGADVSVEGTALHVTSEREGRFLLRDVPPGPRTVVVSYPGFEPAA